MTPAASPPEPSLVLPRAPGQSRQVARAEQRAEADFLGRIMPEDPEAETIVIGGALLWPADLHGIVTFLDGSHFRDKARGDAFALLARAHEDGRPLDGVTFARELAARGIMPLELAKDLSRRAAEAVPTGAIVAEHARRVLDCSHRRDAIAGALRLADSAYRDGPLASTLAEHTTAMERLASHLGPASSPFACYSAPELLAAKLETPEPVIGGGILRHGGVLVLQGEEKLGKTLLAMAMALDLSRGFGDFLGFPIERAARVLYFAAEGGPALAQERLLKIAGPDAPVPPGLVFRFPESNPLDVNTPEGLALLDGEIRRTAAEYVALDPLAETAPSLDENDGAAFKMFLAGLRRVLKRTGCGLVLVHHTAKMGITSRKGSARRGRGSTVLPAFADSIITLEPGDNGLREASFSLRAGADPGVLLLRLNGEAMRFEVEATKAEPAPVGIDRIASLVAQAGPDGMTYQQIAKDLGVAERSVRNALNDYGATVGLEKAPGKPREKTRWRSKGAA